jgi:AcrR family transcriptional regulator
MSRIQSKKKEVISELMRETVYKAARSVIEQYGWTGTTMDRVASEAGIAKGTVYNYFKNKRELMMVVMEKNIEPINEQVITIVQRKKFSTMKDTLSAIVETVIVELIRNKKIIPAMILAFHEDGELRRKFDPRSHPYQNVREVIHKVISQGVNNGEFRPIDPNLAEAMVNSLFSGISRQIALGDIDISKEEVARDVASFVLRGLLAPVEGGTL